MSAQLSQIADGRNRGCIAPAIERTGELVVPSICLLEVFKRVTRQRDESAAPQVAAVMEQGRIVLLDGAVLWTQDADFDGLPRVRFTAKR